MGLLALHIDGEQQQHVDLIEFEPYCLAEHFSLPSFVQVDSVCLFRLECHYHQVAFQ